MGAGDRRAGGASAIYIFINTRRPWDTGTRYPSAKTITADRNFNSVITTNLKADRCSGWRGSFDGWFYGGIEGQHSVNSNHIIDANCNINILRS